jgi:sugar lactone lactonase YvrE
MKVEHVLSLKTKLGEGAIWHQELQQLWMVDIEAGKLIGHTPSTGRTLQVSLEQKAGTVVPVNSEELVIALKDGLYKFFINRGQKLKLVDSPEVQFSNHRFNDGKCDPAGRFWVGTMDMNSKPGVAALYRINKDLKWEKMIGGVTVSNGIIWSPEGDLMYYIDTPTQQVMIYPFDPVSGNLGSGKVAIEYPAELGSPDGCTIDQDGMLWIAGWGGACVSRWDPWRGKLLDKVEVPALNVTSCAFGGPSLDELYITTASIGTSKEDLRKYPLAGDLFRIKPGVKGIPANYFKL